MCAIHHFYHIYADGAWQEPVSEHFLALKTSGLCAQEGFSLNIGFVGNEQKTAAARDFLKTYSIPWREVGWSREGWEQVTLGALAHESQTLEGLAFYAHTKGASNVNRFNVAWRQRMTYFTVTCWRDAISRLRAYDAYGCHWMQLDGHWLFGGNFWWTRMSHLRLLPPPNTGTRWAAEGWVGLLPRYIKDFAVCDPAPPLPGKIRSKKLKEVDSG